MNCRSGDPDPQMVKSPPPRFALPPSPSPVAWGDLVPDAAYIRGTAAFYLNANPIKRFFESDFLLAKRQKQG